MLFRSINVSLQPSLYHHPRMHPLPFPPCLLFCFLPLAPTPCVTYIPLRTSATGRAPIPPLFYPLVLFLPSSFGSLSPPVTPLHILSLASLSPLPPPSLGLYWAFPSGSIIQKRDLLYASIMLLKVYVLTRFTPDTIYPHCRIRLFRFQE